MKVESQRTTVDEAIETLRDSFIKAGRQGSHLLINLNEAAPDFINVYTNPSVLATDVAFNHTEWRKEPIHSAVLKDGENYSSNMRSGGIYYMMPEFTMQIRSTAPNAEGIQDVMSKIPNIDQFACIIIEWKNLHKENHF